MPQINLVLGFDYGAYFLGVAVGQLQSYTAQPYTTLRSPITPMHWSNIQKVITHFLPDVLVVGAPLTMEGSPSRVYFDALFFAYQLMAVSGLPVYTADERCSSVEARKVMKWVKKPEMIHAWSAKYILENWYAEKRRWDDERASPTL